DLTQDVFTALVQKLPEFRYDQGRSFRGWLWTVFRNRWRDRQRHLAGAPPAAGGLDLDGLPGPPAEDPLGAAEYRRYLVDRILRLIQAEFQPVTWKAFLEYIVAGRPPAEVARDLGVTVNAVYLAKCRVLRRLREELDGLLDWRRPIFLTELPGPVRTLGVAPTLGEMRMAVSCPDNETLQQLLLGQVPSPE